MALRVAERTMALPVGRAMFTFGSVPTVMRDVYQIPKMEFSIRLQPYNTLVTVEVNKMNAEARNWADFHNGVAAGLRISPSSKMVDSSWITYNKPAELTAQHAGFLFGLGLSGHLKNMLTWHTFSYLTPKHDLTSIGVLLGLSAANVGTANRHVTKLLAVHTPALLPNPSVDLNVPMLTQAAGLVGVGLLYTGTRNRRMAEVALQEIGRTQINSADQTTDHREAYSLSAALSFGMIMLAAGATHSSPADMNMVSRLRLLIHGEPILPSNKSHKPSFDVTLTSAPATLALALMFLRTGRQDIADILSVPSTLLELHHLQPSLLLVRTLGRSLIMWDQIVATPQWVTDQLPKTALEALEQRMVGKHIDESLELAYFNIISGACFAIGLKYAGTAQEDPYSCLLHFHDQFTRVSNQNSE
jgi:anaphase-promoting complex subunit 1